MFTVSGPVRSSWAWYLYNNNKTWLRVDFFDFDFFSIRFLDYLDYLSIYLARDSTVRMYVNLKKKRKMKIMKKMKMVTSVIYSVFRGVSLSMDKKIGK